jgi:hypothetical protein
MRKCCVAAHALACWCLTVLPDCAWFVRLSVVEVSVATSAAAMLHGALLKARSVLSGRSSAVLCCSCICLRLTSHLSPALLSAAMQVRSVPGGSISISKLSSDYFSTQGVCGTLQLQHHQQQQLAPDLPTPAAAPAGVSVGSAAGSTGGPAAAAAAAGGGVAAKVGAAAPCLFAFDGRWYLLVSKGTGW